MSRKRLLSEERSSLFNRRVVNGGKNVYNLDGSSETTTSVSPSKVKLTLLTFFLSFSDFQEMKE
jgi:hypothetical protein